MHEIPQHHTASSFLTLCKDTDKENSKEQQIFRSTPSD